MSPEVDPEDLPLLGEPAPIELANSLYGEGEEAIDFLESAGHVETWLSHARLSLPCSLPVPFRPADARALRELRDAIRALLRALAAGREAPGGSLDVVNRSAAKAPFFGRLEQDEHGLHAVTLPVRSDPVAVTLGWMATETIALVTGPDRNRLRRCSGPGCSLLFLQRHHRRRWCHPSCGHRARQASYYRRTKARHVQTETEGCGDA